MDTWQTHTVSTLHWEPVGIPAKLVEAALVGHEDYWVVGVFLTVADARQAAARVLKAYRNYWRTSGFEDFPYRPRGNDLHPRITRRNVGEVLSLPWMKP